MLVSDVGRKKWPPLSMVITLLLITAGTTLIYYLNAPFVATTVDTVGYLSALQKIQTTGNVVDVFRLPTYPVFLLAVYALTGQGNLMAVSIAQGLLFICATCEIYLITLIITRQRWLAFSVGVLVGTNTILVSYIKPIMTEGLSLWLLTTIMLSVILFLKTFRYRFFWLNFTCLLLLMFTRPEWFLLPCLLFPYILMRARKNCESRAIFIYLASAILIIYLCIGGYVVANKQMNGLASLSSVSNMNLIGKVIQYRMQNDTPYNPYFSHIYDRFIHEGITSPYQIMKKVPALGANAAQASADCARNIILHHPVKFLLHSLPLFFTSLYHYYPVDLNQHYSPGPFDSFVRLNLSLQRIFYTANILFPFCALIWLFLFFWRKAHHSFCVQSMELVVIVVVYAVVVTTLGGYHETDYMRVHIVFDPLISLVVWSSIGLGFYHLKILFVEKSAC